MSTLTKTIIAISLANLFAPQAEAQSLTEKNQATSSQYKSAFATYEQALKERPDDQNVKSALAKVCREQAGLLNDNHKEALRLYHKSAFLDQENSEAFRQLEYYIKNFLGRNPDSFEDRILLGDKAVEEKDPTGAILEYTAALHIQSNTELTTRLDLLQKFNPSIRFTHTRASEFPESPTEALETKDPKLKSTKPNIVSNGISPAESRALDTYMTELKKRISRAWFFVKCEPNKTALVTCKVHRGGQITDVQVSHSSGNKEFDLEAVRIIHAMSPFKSLPMETARESVDVEFTFNSNTYHPKSSNWREF